MYFKITRVISLAVWKIYEAEKNTIISYKL
jgi:hypothetical protein